MLRFALIMPAFAAATLHLLLLFACLCLYPAVLCSSLRLLDTTRLPTSPTYSTPYESVRGLPYSVSYDDRAIVINGVRTLLVSGSIHYPRFASAEWQHQFDMARLAGLNTVQSYVFWNWHESERRQYDFHSDGHQLTYFLDLAAQNGLFVNLRIGPFVCSEWSYGGIPYWMRQYDDVAFRTNDTHWQYEMGTFFSVIMKLIEPWLARNGGPIILSQVENEYNLASHHTPADDAYVQWCADLATSFDSGLVWGMCQQDNTPQPLIGTCNGIDCYLTIGANRSQPALWTEHWSSTAWNWKWGSNLPHNTAEDMAYAGARWFAAGGGYMNYYMFSGGTTFGRWTGGPLLVNSYDYESPVTEYGLARVDKFAHLSLLHYILQQYSSIIIDSDMAVNRQQQLSSNVLLLTYGNALFGLLFFVNTADNKTAVEWQDYVFDVAGTSVQLRDWYTFELLYDSSNVTQSLAVVRAAHVMDAYITPASSASRRVEPDSVAYIDEPHFLYQQEGVVQSKQPLELISLAQYDSDHVYYETNVTLTKRQQQAGTVVVNVTNAVEHFHLFFAGTFIGFSSSGSDAFSVDVRALSSGTAYRLTLVVQADGSVNCCGNLEDFQEGPLGDITVDGQSIYSAGWLQLVGLQGERNQLFTPNSTAAWQSLTSASSKPFVWYQLSIRTPAVDSSSPFVTYALDLTYSMGKGQAWMNGHHLGRYWNATDEDGKYTQRYNHVPAAWMAAAGQLNVLVLWEELGGDPTHVRLFQVLCCDPLN